VLTFPMWITVNILGRPDNGVILRATRQLPDGGCVPPSACISVLTKNQVIAPSWPAVCFVLV
jgi:ABC-2 type transport system permease protein